MAGVSLNNSLREEFDNLDLEHFFDEYKMLKTSKGKDAVLYHGI